MKKNLLLLFILTGFVVNAQITVGEDSVHAEFTSDEPEIVVHNTQKTDNPTTTVKWEVVSVEVSAGWENDFFICDAIQCWDSTTNYNQYDLTDTKLYPLDCHFLNNGNVGEGHAVINIWEVGDSANTARSVVFTVSVDQESSIKSSKSLKLDIYPNPTSDYLHINNLNPGEISKIEVYNIIGKKLYQNNQVNSKNTINVSDYERGIYIIRVTDKNQNIYSQNFTKK